VRVALFGHQGKVGSVLAPALEAAGHDVRRVGRGEEADLSGVDAAVDFTQPDAAAGNVRAALEQGVPAVVGTSGLGGAELEELEALALDRSLQLLVVPNFAIGAVLMMRFAEAAAEYLPRTEIVELHHESKQDAPSGTARATAERLPGEPPIHSVRLPGLVAHQEVLLGGDGQLLTIRHDTFSREAFVPGVLLALDKLATLPPGLTIGLERLLVSSLRTRAPPRLTSLRCCRSCAPTATSTRSRHPMMLCCRSREPCSPTPSARASNCWRATKAAPSASRRSSGAGRRRAPSGSAS